MPEEIITTKKLDDSALNKEIGNWLYFLVKNAKRLNYREFLEDIGITPDVYKQIKEKVETTFGIQLYV